ncbi:MAG TPA: AarF/UbiB family protein, partial [Solirubrobacteraceae bacterium]|nr:AarF/UbiB family protein [Solirubrobacteraceae bacterium]
MAARADLPPAVAALVQTGAELLRRAPSARLAIARLDGLIDLSALPPELAAAAQDEVRAARESVCVELDRKTVEQILKSAWGRPVGKVLDSFDATPLAVTPAGQVHRGELDDGTAVAVKVRRPGVERSVRNDLALLDVVAAPLGAAFPRLDAGAVLRDVREQALDELDFEHEASTLRRLSRALRGVEGVEVPRPELELSTPEVLVTTLLRGETLASGARPDDPSGAARAIVAAFRAAVLETGLAPYDLRATHVLVGGRGGGVGLLGLGVARPIDKARAAAALRGLVALAGADEAGVARVAVEDLGVLPSADVAGEAAAVLRE